MWLLSSVGEVRCEEVELVGQRCTMVVSAAGVLCVCWAEGERRLVDESCRGVRALCVDVCLRSVVLLCAAFCLLLFHHAVLVRPAKLY